MTRFNICLGVDQIAGTSMRLPSLKSMSVALASFTTFLLVIAPLAGYSQSNLHMLTSSRAVKQHAAGPSAPTTVTSIRAIDFRNFRFPSSCSKDDPQYPAIIPVKDGKWEKGSDTASADYEVSPPEYARLLGARNEQAMIVASCFLGNWSDTEVFVYGISHGRPVLIQRLTDSDWAPEGCWTETVNTKLKNDRLVVSFLSGGIHARPAWSVTTTMKWNGKRFVRADVARKPFNP